MSASTASLPASFALSPTAASSGASGQRADVVPKTERSDAWPASDEAAQPAPEGPIRAYAKLEFPGFSYYVQTLEVTIGRRPGQLQNGAALPMRAPQTWRKGDVDVDLGPLKSISRLHARIFYSVQPHFYQNPMNLSPMMPSGASAPASPSGAEEPAASDEGAPAQGRFLLEVLGRNGAFVDDVWVRMNGVVPLGRRTKIQIAERVFYFVLPPPASEQDGFLSEAEESEVEAEDAASSSSELSDVDTEKPATTSGPSTESPGPKLVLKPRSKISPSRKDAKKRPHDDQDADTSKRRRGTDEASAPLPVGTPIGIEALKPARGKGKGKGKGKTEPQVIDLDADTPSVEETPAPEASAAAPSSLSALATAATQVGSPVPSGTFQKPELTNVELITNALTSESCLRKGNKLTLQEVYEWLQNTYPWFGQNGRKTGRDWQSSIRHTIGTSREFVKIPRRPDEHGKGIFYTLATSDVAKEHEATRSVAQPEPAPPAPSASAPRADDTRAAPEKAEKPLPRIPLVVGIPPGTGDANAARAKNVPGSIESLLETPPIAHHQGKLYLSPKVFGHLTPEQLQHIEGLGAQQALQVLQAYLVSHLKEKMKKPDAAKGTPGPSPPLAGKAAPSPPASKNTAASPPVAAKGAAGSPPPLPQAAPQPSVYDQRLEPPKVPRIPISPSDALQPTQSKEATPAAPLPAAPLPAAQAAPPTQAAPSTSTAPAPSIPTNPGPNAEKTDPLAALSALAAHPEAAGLIGLLQKQQSGAAGGTVKLTPGQLELLQLANRLAMQKKNKKKKTGDARQATQSPAAQSPAAQSSAGQSPPKPSSP